MLQVLTNAASAGALYCLAALGFALIYFTTKDFHLAHGAVIGVGGYLAWLATVEWGQPVATALLIAALGSAAAGVAMEWLVYRRMRARCASPEVVLIASLALYLIAVNVIALVAGNEVRLLRTGAAPVALLGGARVTYVQLLIIGTSVLSAGLLAIALRWSAAGRMWRAIADSSTLAELSGLNVLRTRTAVFFVGSAMGGLAGALVSLDVGVEPHFGFPVAVAAITACVVGGLGRYLAPVLGATALALVEAASVAIFSARWKTATSFCVLLFFLAVRPRGILGRTVRTEET